MSNYSVQQNLIYQPVNESTAQITNSNSPLIQDRSTYIYEVQVVYA